MSITFSPYINFKKTTRQAMEFYQTVFGGKLVMNTYKDFNASQDPSEDNLIMHAELLTDKGYSLMAADMPDRMEYRAGTNFGLTLSGNDQAQLTDWFNKLSVGGMITMPLEKSTWGDTFGMLVDQFGVSWMVNISAS